MAKFNYQLDYSQLDLRLNPKLYTIGVGEQGVLLVEPYKSEILPYWAFKTPEIALKSAKKIYKLFLVYKKQEDFVGMDMARKFLKMGFTRSRRYANHKSGVKYTKNKTSILPLIPDTQKAQSAAIFYEYYSKAKNDPEYKKLKKIHKQLYNK